MVIGPIRVAGGSRLIRPGALAVGPCPAGLAIEGAGPIGPAPRGTDPPGAGGAGCAGADPAKAVIAAPTVPMYEVLWRMIRCPVSSSAGISPRVQKRPECPARMSQT